MIIAPRVFFHLHLRLSYFFFFFFNDPATTEIYTLSLHDALPISRSAPRTSSAASSTSSTGSRSSTPTTSGPPSRDRKSTRLNSSHLVISYAVFCLKKKKKKSYISTPYLIIVYKFLLYVLLNIFSE